METEQEAALGELEEELKARALAEMDEQELQQDCEQNAAEESAGQVVSKGTGSANNAAAAPMEDDDLAAAVGKEREALRRDLEEVVPAVGRARAREQARAGTTLLAQRQASRQQERAESWSSDFHWGPPLFPP